MPNVGRLFYSIDEVAELTGLAVITVRRMIYAGELEYRKARGRYLIPAKAVETIGEGAGC